MRLRGLLLAMALLPAARSADPLAGRVAGPATQCIDLDRVQGPAIQADARTILYPQTRARIWRTEPIGACPGLAGFARLVVEVQGRRLCRGDRFHPIPQSSTVPLGECRFAAFTPYDLPR